MDGDNSLTSLVRVSPSVLARTLGDKYKTGERHSYIGNILVSVSNCEPDTINRDDEEELEHYLGRGCGQQPPHPYALADEVYSAMLHSGDQLVVLCGVSGSGKTSTAARVLHYLTYVGGVEGVHTSVAAMVGAVPALLNTLCGARTLMCESSTRMGSVTNVYFDADGLVVGGKVELLYTEPFRVTLCQPLETNFHIFYVLLDSEESVLSKYGLTGDPMDYAFLCSGGVAPPVDPHIVAEFEEAMSAFSFNHSQREELYTILAAICHLGNIEFIDEDNTDAHHGAARHAVVLNRDILQQTATLLAVSATTLESALVSYVHRIPGESPVEEALDASHATANRDALARTLYTLCVRHIIAHINGRMSSVGHVTSIALVDTTGFECLNLRRRDMSVYPANNFEQFVVNTVNERLRHTYTDHVIEREVKLYQRENVPIAAVAPSDNEACVQLCEDLIANALAESCGRVDVTNRSFLDRLNRQLDPRKEGLVSMDVRVEPTDHYGRVRMNRYQTDETDFVVAHYAGAVQYSVSHANKNNELRHADLPGFVEKNREHVPGDFIDLLFTSKSTVFKALGKFDDGLGLTEHWATHVVRTMRALVTRVSGTSPFFVVCLSPNADGDPGRFDSDWVRDQVDAYSLTQTVQVRRTGFPFRMSLRAFAGRYACVAAASGVKSEDTQTVVDAVFRGENVPRDGWFVGREYVFLKSDVFSFMEEFRYAILENERKLKIEAAAALKAFVLMARTLDTLPALIDALRPVADRLARKRELVDGPEHLSPEAADAILDVEEGLAIDEAVATRGSASHEAKAGVIARANHAASVAIERFPALLDRLDSLINEAWDPEHQAQLRQRKEEAISAMDALESALSDVHADWAGEGNEVRAIEAAAHIVALIEYEEEHVADEEDKIVEYQEAEEERVAAIARAQFAERQHELEMERLSRLRAKEDARISEMEREKALFAAERDAILHDREIYVQRKDALEKRREVSNTRREVLKAEAEKQRELQHDLRAKREKIAKMKAVRLKKIIRQKGKAKTAVLAGTRVLYKNIRATIRYCGHLPFAQSGVWLGIECDKRLKEGNNGSCLGVQFFRCEDNRGLFVRPESVLQILEGEELFTGATVVVKSLTGVIRYLGPVHFDDDTWAGIELHKEGAGKHDGVVQGQRYFSCPAGQGVFVRASAAAVIGPWDEDGFSEKYMQYCIEQDLLTDEELHLIATDNPYAHKRFAISADVTDVVQEEEAMSSPSRSLNASVAGY